MECRDVRGLNTDSVGPGPSAGFYLGMFMAFGGQSSNRNYFQFRRHRFFLKYPSFGMNKPDRSLLTLPMTPSRINGKR